MLQYTLWLRTYVEFLAPSKGHLPSVSVSAGPLQRSVLLPYMFTRVARTAAWMLASEHAACSASLLVMSEELVVQE